MKSTYQPSQFTVIRDWSEFTGLSEPEIHFRIAGCLVHAAEEWNQTVDVNNHESVEKFYTQSDYLYEVLSSYSPHMRPFKEPTLSEMLETGKQLAPKHGRVLEFGGGTGEFCLCLASHFEHVTYVDLPGRLMEFARWRFKKYDAPIEVIETRADQGALPSDSYDMIFSDAALEHVLDLSYWLKLLTSATKPNGYLYLKIDNQENESFPMHTSANKGAAFLMRENGAPEVYENIFQRSSSLKTSLKHLQLRLALKLKRSAPLRTTVGAG